MPITVPEASRAAHGSSARVPLRPRAGVAFTLLAGLITSIGCAGAPGLDLRPEPGVTTVWMQNRVAEPYQLERVTFTIDGATVALSALPPVDSEGVVMARLRLSPGPHALQVFAAASHPTAGSEHGPSVMTLNTVQAFRVDEAPAALRIAISSAPKLEVSFVLKGGELAPTVGSSGPGDGIDPGAAAFLATGTTHRAGVAHCEKRAPVGRAVCRAESMLERASTENDVVVVACLRDKLGKLRDMAAILGPRSNAVSPAPAGQDGSPIAERELLLIADERAALLMNEAERCIGAEGVEAPVRSVRDQPTSPQSTSASP